MDAYTRGERSQPNPLSSNPYREGSEDYEDWIAGRSDAQMRAWRGDTGKPFWPYVLAGTVIGLGVSAGAAWAVYRICAYIWGS